MNLTRWKVTIIVYFTICTSREEVRAECSETAETETKYESRTRENPNYDYYIYKRYGYADRAPTVTDQIENFVVVSITVSCQNINLTTEMPLPLPSEPRHGCSNCPQLLNIIQSTIPIIPPSAFSNYPSTTKLDIRENEIENILPGAFNSLISLDELYLSNNNISHISDGVFNSLTKLRILDLSANKIQNISKHAFSGTMKLEVLNLSSNSLIHLDSTFLGELTKLDLSFNEMTFFNFSEISDQIEYLDLSNNLIDNIYGCFGGISNLNLNHNLLKSLDNVTCLNNISNIISLDLSYNLLSKIEQIPNLDSITILNLQNNKINIISIDFFSQLNNMTFLNLSSNELEQFQYGLFDRLIHLEMLDVSNNHLTEFKKFIYHSLINLRHLYLTDNKITTIDSKDFTNILPSLSEISLDGNNFSCEILVDIFHNLRKITILPGHTFASSNIRGIACSERETDKVDLFKENADINTTGLYDSLRRKLNELLNIDFTNSSMYKYFNSGFKESNFYKYLENLSFVRNLSVKSYEDNVKNIQNFEEFQQQFNSFAKNLEKTKVGEYSLKNGDAESSMYNYLNKGFVNSSFYKYLESLKKPQFTIKYYADTNGTKAERIVNSLDNPEENNNNSSLLVVIVILLLIISCTMLIFMYISYKYIWKMYNLRNIHVELAEN